MPNLQPDPSPSGAAFRALDRAAAGARLLAALVSLLLAGTSTNASDTPEPAASAPTTPSDLVLILDASGSMWGRVGDQPKIVLARQVLGDVLDDLTDDRPVGLVAYGHRRKGDCSDIEILREVGPLDRAAMKARVDKLNPRGKTPITASFERALELVESRPGPATIVMISDGLETCDADPCAAVRAARARGVEFRLHVVGFDVRGKDVSQLQCAADAGDGLFLHADDAAQLSEALDQAVTEEETLPDARLIIEARTNGELQDVAIHVDDLKGGEVEVWRTYAAPETNPSSIPLAAGEYRVRVLAIGIDGDNVRTFPLTIADGEDVERAVDFSTGTLAVNATRNGDVSDVTYRVYVASSNERAAQGRTYSATAANPSNETLTAGRYRIELTAVEIAGQPKLSLGEFDIEPGSTTSLQHEFQSGELRVGATSGGQLTDAVVRVYRDRSPVAQGRTYVSPDSNPKRFTLEPGTYRVDVKPIGGTKRSIEVVVGAEQDIERIVDF